MIEAFVGLLITMIALSIALQLFVAAAYLRAQTRKFEEVYDWIQDDFESVRALATDFESDALPHSSLCGAGDANSFAASFIAANTVGLGGSDIILKTETVSDQTYQLRRTASYATTTSPKQIVGLRYELIAADTGNTEIAIDAEVVMYASFRCPG